MPCAICKWGNDKYILIGAAGAVSDPQCGLFIYRSGDDLRGKRVPGGVSKEPVDFPGACVGVPATVILCNAAITVGILAIYYVLMFGASLFVSTFWDSHVAMGVLFP